MGPSSSPPDRVGPDCCATPWLAGAEFSVADIAHYPWLRRLDYAGLAAADYPEIARWCASIAARPATVAALLRMGMD